MVNRKTKAKRSLSALPKGLPIRGQSGRKMADSVNPFEVTAKNKRQKHTVVNRPSAKVTSQSSLARSMKERQTKLREELKRSKKSNSFVDRRIGEYDRNMTPEEQNLARLVRERARRSKRSGKFSLEDDEGDENEGGDILTHQGKAIDSLSAKDHVVLSDDDELDAGGQLDAVDTMQHFGGGTDSRASVNPYGPSGGDPVTLAQRYSSRKMELDDLIARSKLQKSERVKSKEAQVEAFEKMDESFKDLAALLDFRDKEQEIRDYNKARREGNLSEAEKEFENWDKEMKQYQFLERRVAATDRTKTPDEIAKEEADRLHALETRRLARMNGDYAQDDDFSDISVAQDDEDPAVQRDPKKARLSRNSEQLDGDSEDENSKENEVRARFTADGLVQVDRNGMVVGKIGEKRGENSNSSEPLAVGDKVMACYRAKEQFDGQVSWYEGVVSKVNMGRDGSVTYDVDYDDGDFEDGIEPQHIRPVDKSKVDMEKELSKKQDDAILTRKRQKATEKARTEMPFVFEVPTTLEALHELIGEHAKTGKEAMQVIRRICISNSVRLDRRNTEKMQNFYDVVLRRFIAVGDAIYHSGDGGPELSRYSQLDSLTEVLYNMAQDSPESAGAVWARRLGILYNAHAKRLRDSEFERDEDEGEFSAWPSTGVLLLLRALDHIFPVTDKRHYVVTPALLLLGKFVAHTPVYSMSDLTMGVFCSGLLIEYTKEAKRIVPEALGFLAGVVRLFAASPLERRQKHTNPNLAAAAEEEEFQKLREKTCTFGDKEESPMLSIEKDDIVADQTPAGILGAALSILESTILNLEGSMENAEREVFAEISGSVMAVRPPDGKGKPLPPFLVEKVSNVTAALLKVRNPDSKRAPLRRRAVEKKGPAIMSLAPRLEKVENYRTSKDKGKNAEQTAMDRTRRELKRERKAISRELRLDAAFVESERREDEKKKDAAAKAKRHKAFAWMESEQATMNQQVAQGGGLLRGGGTGAARVKARSGKIGMKKGGKLKR